MSIELFDLVNKYYLCNDKMEKKQLYEKIHFLKNQKLTKEWELLMKDALSKIVFIP